MNSSVNKIIVIVCLALIAASFSSVATAQIRRRGNKSPFAQNDKNADGKLSKAEFPGPDQAFKKIDQNGDGYISRQEAKESRQKAQQSGMMQQKGRGQKQDQKQLSGQTQQSTGELKVDIWQKDKACNGTTLFALIPRIVEVDMQGNVVWEYKFPQSLRKFTSPGMDVELLANNNILVVFPKKGVYEINRDGNIVWQHLDEKISHDADRLPNGNTIYIWGVDKKDEAQVKEVDPSGKVVWSWKAKKDFDKDPYKDLARGGWTHANAVTRLPNGNTIVCLRNLNLTVEVNPQGEVVWTFDWTAFGKDVDPHEPEIQANNNMLIATQRDAPYQAVEIDRTTGKTVWKYAYPAPGLRTPRDADRLPNGNTLIVGVIKKTHESIIFEVTPAGEIVWQLGLKNCPAKRGDKRSPGWFYKAERIPAK